MSRFKDHAKTLTYKEELTVMFSLMRRRDNWRKRAIKAEVGGDQAEHDRCARKVEGARKVLRKLFGALP